MSRWVVLPGFAKDYLLSSDSYRNWFGHRTIFARIVSSARVKPFPRSSSVCIISCPTTTPAREPIFQNTVGLAVVDVLSSDDGTV